MQQQQTTHTLFVTPYHPPLPTHIDRASFQYSTTRNPLCIACCRPPTNKQKNEEPETQQAFRHCGISFKSLVVVVLGVLTSTSTSTTTATATTATASCPTGVEDRVEGGQVRL